MGGDRISPLISSTDEESLLEQEFQEYLESTGLRGGGSSSKMKDGLVDDDKDVVCRRLDDDVGAQLSSTSSVFKAKQIRERSVYNDVLRSYIELQGRTESLTEAKRIIRSYYPGAWIEKRGGMKLSDYSVPNATSLLLIGPKRSGKSSLVNRISRVFDDDKFAPERAQVSFDAYVEDGTYFLQEYMIPRGSTSVCLYDTRSFSDDAAENMEMLDRWMTKGVRHGELVRKSDSPSLKTRLKGKAKKNHHCSSMIRMVNYVIFVVSGLSVLNSMETSDEDGYIEMIETMFNCPLLSLRDDKPVLVITHTDLLALSDRARVRVTLGKRLGIPPLKQMFDIPENCDPASELTIVDLIRYSLEHADKNLPYRVRFLDKVLKVPQPKYLLLALTLGIAILLALVHDAPFNRRCRHHVSPKDTPIDWSSIRYMWLGQEYS